MMTKSKEQALAEPSTPQTKEKKKGKKWYIHKNVNNGQESFAAGLNIYKVIWVFVFGCVIGVLWEFFYVYALTGVFMRRSGMLYGPFNQIYGFGAVLLTVILYRFRDKNKFVIFTAAAIIGLAFEYCCSWIQEFLLGSVSWDYSGYATSIGGRTNLLYGFGWGIMGYLFITSFWPWMSEMIERIPNTFGKTLSIVVIVFLALDLALSGAAVFRERQREEGVPATNAVAEWLDKTYPNDVMSQKYPSMEFISNSEDTPENETNSSVSKKPHTTRQRTL